MKNYIKILFGVLVIGMVISCVESTDVVESGTYTGTIAELNADETEIYVETAKDQRLELYFTETTELTQNGETISFSTLEEGNRVEVQVEKVVKRLDPISVKLLE